MSPDSSQKTPTLFPGGGGGLARHSPTPTVGQLGLLLSHFYAPEVKYIRKTQAKPTSMKA